MAITTFIPEVWSARLLENLQKSMVYGNLVNRNYEGEISQYGDTVHINTLSDISIKTYTANTDIASPDQLTTTEQTLVIDQGDYFNIYLNDVDKAQARADLMDTAMANTAYGFADKTEQYIAGLLAGASGAITTGLGSTSSPLSITASNAYETVVKIKTALDKANVPKQGRYIVMPPEFEGMMLLDARFAGGTGTNAESRLADGAVAKACGIDIYISNNVPNTSGAKYKVVASYNDSCTFADQILKTEAYRRESGFDDGVKGLHVYGAKVTRGGAIAVATVNFS